MDNRLRVCVILIFLIISRIFNDADGRASAETRWARGNGAMAPGTMPGTQSTMRRAHPHESGHLPPMQLISAVWCTLGELTCARYSAPFARRHLSAPHTPPVACTDTHSMPEQYRAPALSRFAQCVHASTPAATRTLPTPAAATQQPKGEREREKERERGRPRELLASAASHMR